MAMGKPGGSLEHDRRAPPKRPVEERIRDWREIEGALPPDQLERQAGRCADCGIPFCHAFGCPVANRIPEVNDAICRGQWRRALDLLHSTNNFPEITGRVCPAPCEAACTLAVCAEGVTIRQIELAVVERGFQEGWIVPQRPLKRTGKRVAVIGSGPAGLAAAQQLARAGHDVTVFEKSPAVGGILRYGIPDFKLEKWVLDRRLDQMRAEGVRFETSVEVGLDLSARYLRRTFDAILIAAGAAVPRDLKVLGRGLEGIHFAMPYLVQQNRRNAGEAVPHDEEVLARDRDVVVLGGGDTGSDCVGTARRQGARSITQIELLPEPPAWRAADNPWPAWPNILRTSTSHEEGCTRLWSVLAKEFLGVGVRVRGLRCARLRWSGPDADGKRTYEEVPDSTFDVKADLVLLALGFVGTEHGPLVRDLGLPTGPRGSLAVDEAYRTSAEGVFAAGDAMAGPSLVVRAIAHGRAAAEAMDRYLRQQPQP
jgi:NAD(P)H-dependent glutamate synthase small subunit